MWGRTGIDLRLSVRGRSRADLRPNWGRTPEPTHTHTHSVEPCSSVRAQPHPAVWAPPSGGVGLPPYGGSLGILAKTMRSRLGLRRASVPSAGRPIPKGPEALVGISPTLPINTTPNRTIGMGRRAVRSAGGVVEIKPTFRCRRSSFRRVAGMSPRFNAADSPSRGVSRHVVDLRRRFDVRAILTSLRKKVLGARIWKNIRATGSNFCLELVWPTPDLEIWILTKLRAGCANVRRNPCFERPCPSDFPATARPSISRRLILSCKLHASCVARQVRFHTRQGVAELGKTREQLSN